MTQFQNYVCPHKEQQDLVYHHTFHNRFLNPTKFLWQNTWSEFEAVDRWVHYIHQSHQMQVSSSFLKHILLDDIDMKPTPENVEI